MAASVYVIESHGKNILNQRALREMQGENLQKEAGAHVSGIRRFVTRSFFEDTLWMNCAEICKLAKKQKSTT